MVRAGRDRRAPRTPGQPSLPFPSPPLPVRRVTAGGKAAAGGAGPGGRRHVLAGQGRTGRGHKGGGGGARGDGSSCPSPPTAAGPARGAALPRESRPSSEPALNGRFALSMLLSLLLPSARRRERRELAVVGAGNGTLKLKGLPTIAVCCVHLIN